MNKGKSYFKNLFSGVGIFTTLLVICLAMTIFVANYEFGIIGAIMSSKSVLTFALVVIGIAVVLAFIYLCLCAKKDKLTLADNIALASIVIGIALAVYFAMTNGVFSLRRILAILVFIVFGFVYLLIRSHSFATAKKKEYAPHSIKGYYATIIKKYPLPLVIFLSALLVCITFLACASGFVRLFFRTNRLATVIACAVLAIPIIAWALKGTTKSTINFVDALLLSVVIVFPISLIQILLTAFSTYKMLAWAIALAVYLIVMFVRFSKFDLSKKCIAEADYSGNYLKCVASKYSLLEILALASFMALILFVMLKTSVLYSAITLLLKGNMAYRVLPILLLSGFVFATIGICALGALVGVRNKQLATGDFMLMTLITFAVASIIVYAVDQSILLLFAVAVLVLYSLILVIVRTITLRNK